MKRGRHHSHNRYTENPRGCTYCGAQFDGLPFKCKFCGRLFCSNHYLPEKHECWGLQQKKREWNRNIGTWVYRPETQTPVQEIEIQRNRPADRPPLNTQIWDRPINRFRHWFFSRTEWYEVRKTKLLFDTIYLFLILGILEFLKATNAFSTLQIWIIPLQMAITLALWIAGIKFAYDIFVNLSYGFKGLANGPKLILLLAICGTIIYSISAPTDSAVSASQIIRSATNFNLTFGPAINMTAYYENYTINQQLEKSKFIAQTEQVIFEETNKMRRQNGVPPLLLDTSLSDIAREHSQDMADQQFFSHTNLNGEDPTGRAERHGYPTTRTVGSTIWMGIGENIGKMPTGNVEGMGYIASTPEAVGKAQVQSWMESPGHRENILNPNYVKIGIGTGFDGEYYFSTQDFS